MLSNQVANTLVFTKVVIAVCLSEGAFGNIRAYRALAWLEGVFDEVLINDKMC